MFIFLSSHPRGAGRERSLQADETGAWGSCSPDTAFGPGRQRVWTARFMRIPVAPPMALYSQGLTEAAKSRIAGRWCASFIPLPSQAAPASRDPSNLPSSKRRAISGCPEFRTALEHVSERRTGGAARASSGAVATGAGFGSTRNTGSNFLPDALQFEAACAVRPPAHTKG